MGKRTNHEVEIIGETMLLGMVLRPTLVMLSVRISHARGIWLFEGCDKGKGLCL